MKERTKINVLMIAALAGAVLTALALVAGCIGPHGVATIGWAPTSQTGNSGIANLGRDESSPSADASAADAQSPYGQDRTLTSDRDLNVNPDGTVQGGTSNAPAAIGR